MAYTPTQWVNGQPPALNAENLNNIEGGIVLLDNQNEKITKYLTMVEPANWFNKITATYGAYLDNDDIPHTNSDYAYSDYVPVNEGEVVYFGYISTLTGNAIAQNGRFINAYDENKAIITSKSTQNRNNFTIPAGVKYIRVTVDVTQGDREKRIISKGTLLNHWEEYAAPYYVAGNEFVSGQIAGIEAATEGLDEIKEKIEIRESNNLFDVTAITAGKYVGDNGALQNNSSYTTSDFIPVEEGKRYTYQFTNGSNVVTINTMNQIAGYDENKVFVAGSYKTYATGYTVPAGVKYIRFSRDSRMDAASKPAFVKSVVPVDYEPYSNVINTVYRVKREAVPYKQYIPNGIVERFDLDSVKTHTIKTKMNNMSNYDITFRADITAFNQLTLAKGLSAFYGFNVVITASEVKVYLDGSSTATNTYTHGLTFADYIGVRISVATNIGTYIEIMTNGGKYKTPLIYVDGRLSTIDAVASSSTVLKNCVMSYYCAGLDCDTWIFGDSYVSCSDPSRWTRYLIDTEHRNYMIDGYGGRNSLNGLSSFLNCIKYNLPKRVVWCMGMNDEDTASAINTNWLSAFNTVKEKCEEIGAELIAATIPNVPERNHTFKNEVVRASGLRYIDFALAVGASADTTWYTGMLSNDGVHPTAEGAKALYSQAIGDVPELLG